MNLKWFLFYLSEKHSCMMHWLSFFYYIYFFESIIWKSSWLASSWFCQCLHPHVIHPATSIPYCVHGEGWFYHLISFQQPKNLAQHMKFSQKLHSRYLEWINVYFSIEIEMGLSIVLLGVYTITLISFIYILWSCTFNEKKKGSPVTKAPACVIGPSKVYYMQPYPAFSKRLFRMINRSHGRNS